MLLKEIAELTAGVLTDKKYENLEILGISSIDRANENQISFIVKPQFVEEAKKSKAAALFVRDGWDLGDKPVIVVKDPYWAYATISLAFEDQIPNFGSGISADAIIDKSAKIASGVSIAPRVVIGENVVVGKNTLIDASVVIEKNTIIGENCYIQSGAIIRYGTKIGKNVVISSGAVIGSDGFANAFNGKEFKQIACFGAVTIEDDVQIGANTTIDRGNFEDTIIKKGARIDNLVMIAHNCQIGESCGIAAQVGFAGSTKIGNRVMIAGQAGFGGHISIGDDSFVGGQAGIQQSYGPNSKITGSPAIDLMKRRRIDKIEENLPDTIRDFKKLCLEFNELKERFNAAS